MKYRCIKKFNTSTGVFYKVNDEICEHEFEKLHISNMDKFVKIPDITDFMEDFPNVKCYSYHD